MLLAAPETDDVASFVRDDVIGNVRHEGATAGIALLVLSVALLVLCAASWMRHRYRHTARWTEADDLRCRGAHIVAVSLLLAELVLQVHEVGWLTHADRPVLSWFVAHRSGAWTALAKVLTELASPVGTVLLALLLAGVLWTHHRKVGPAALFVGVVATTAVLNTGVKSLVERARPPHYLQLIAEHDYSFPSGHVAGITALSGAIILTFGAERSRRWTAIATALALLAVAAVAATRLYLGVHWLTDTVGGALLGGLVVMCAAFGSIVFPHLTETRRTPDPSGGEGGVDLETIASKFR